MIPAISSTRCSSVGPLGWCSAASASRTAPYSAASSQGSTVYRFSGRLGRRPRLSAHQKREALARREAGEPLAEIARSYTVNAGSPDTGCEGLQRISSHPPAAPRLLYPFSSPADRDCSFAQYRNQARTAPGNVRIWGMRVKHVSVTAVTPSRPKSQPPPGGCLASLRQCPPSVSWPGPRC